ncbi:CPBP family intramembrane glutamic endopeptidase [Micromonospora foliorum]|uniref:CPBP family intramembrane glutamic endopeptidase n=1 Tax=Micromonospora foliorum TaxID=2911210 RepID=UPI001EE956DD|nr:type II CAAX endopeptidase family protein [Micromonospora foliorum]MCG5435407.1 CPBP family intramembrane metalloprotease [Micromonospora foliorum]
MTTATSARQHDGLTTFWIVTFAWAFAFWLFAITLDEPAMTSPTLVPYLLGGFGPAIGAIAVRIRRHRRRQPIPAHTVRLRLRPRLFWALPMLALASGTVLAAVLLAEFLGGPALSLTEGRELIATAGGTVPFLISMLIGGPLAEEPGWRGTAYPRLRASMSRLHAGLLLGAAWAVWHLPLFFINGTLQSEFGLVSWSGLLFTLSVFPMALLTGYAYELAGVAASVAVHFGVNTTIALLTVKAPAAQALVLAVQIIVAAALLASQRNRGQDRPALDHREMADLR